ncbi:hypothetical protein BIV57_13145 [Mangrovactinospora gilvigrisea]|uniref:MOSC domain-containing protein n=1 Tax=Mangrovactinospora gilvigrisea TaxID=1428644 RepID=A0A1J7C650_9ACTN|nr:hypothetical protein BIV57_13145 [Mangrovactinospora gilvigrisea]
MQLGPEAVVEVTGLRNPCGQIDRFWRGLLKKVLLRDGDGEVVRRAGIMSVVQVGGEVRPGMPVRAQVPAPPHTRLGPV